MYLGTDPDNVAPPMAAAFGDLGTVTLLLWANYYSSEFPDGAQILALVILLAVFFFGPFLLRCDETMNTPTELRGLLINRNTLMGSITPLLGAVLMSSHETRTADVRIKIALALTDDTQTHAADGFPVPQILQNTGLVNVI
ncbi:PI3kinase [Clonorchis sinensis]|uniref:PI3kinase n=1 Tax=Clonorchis sinensis TaxID=79923 RepID=G7YQR5_CLOSI|nr:PI3kinase [Clonorchis sinensis]